MRKFCVYGKGGIGKSTMVSNIAAALAEDGKRVMVIGCDPKADSTRSLIGKRIPTILDAFREKGPGRMKLEDIVFVGFKGVYCAESGGPEPGIGCAGRGVITAAEMLTRLGAFKDLDLDVLIYDVLGDVVCGGFAMPLRNGLVDDVYIVTTCDSMSIYAANNICKGIKRFAERGDVFLGGIIYNGRSVVDEPSIIDGFAARLGTQVVGRMPMNDLIPRSEIHHKTVIEYTPDSEIAEIFKRIGRNILENRKTTVPKPLSDEELNEINREVEDLFREKTLTQLST
ncbi:MAG: nitrogenase iron protein [Methanothrix sp.]|jgi:nitrogenase iron protein NifH|uniref:nitrogenase iron protein n=1 Tax=Methanothrix sp. TaxID=90426 RepID=UPI0025E8ACDB|nr:nitrogenase iron protein [Methanothrix sp.]MBK7385245.1 nitrogenase iron protein [Methanothrix sp.]